MKIGIGHIRGGVWDDAIGGNSASQDHLQRGIATQPAHYGLLGILEDAYGVFEQSLNSAKSCGPLVRSLLPVPVWRLLPWSQIYPNFFKLTMRMDMAAGVTPEILEACPIEIGLNVDSFSFTSVESPMID